MAQTKRPPTGHARTLELPDGDDVTVVVDGREGNYTQLVVECGPRWRLDVHDTGDVVVLASYTEAGQVADVPLPEWLPALLEELGWRGVEL